MIIGFQSRINDTLNLFDCSLVLPIRPKRYEDKWVSKVAIKAKKVSGEGREMEQRAER